MADSERIPVGRVGGLVAANVAAVVGHFTFAVVTAMTLPARYPVHFNAAGQPDRWAESGSVEWYSMPLFSLGMAVFLVGLALLLPRIPLSLVNLPNKEQFMKLSVAERTPIMQYLIRFLLWVALVDTVLLLSIHWMMYRAAVRSPASLSWVGLGVTSALYIYVIVRGIVRTSRMVRDATAKLPPDPVG